MATNGASRLRLGDMLVGAELISVDQLQEALRVQRDSGMRLGKQLVKLGYVTEVQVTQTLSNQLSIPWVSIAHIEFSKGLLQRVPGEVADRCSVMPIYVRSVRGQGDTLYVAMDDPTDHDALTSVSSVSGLPVRPMVAPPSDIRAAIERHYFGAPEPETRRPPMMRTSRPPSPPPPRPSTRPSTGPVPKRPSDASLLGERVPTGTRKKPPPPEGVAKRTPDEVPLDFYLKPSAPPNKPVESSGLTLTLLDGTTLAVPGAPTSKALSEIREVRHLMKSIRAAQRAGAAGGPPTWEEVLQVLLSLVNERGVGITRREFAEAWLRQRGTGGSDPSS